MTPTNNLKLKKEEELQLINKHTTTPLTEEQVFCFNITLCDNEVDRDFECFSTDSLEILSKLFIGKTGISDHSMRSKDQCARIFYTYVETDNTKTTSYGEVYVALKARAYMLRTEENSTLISEIKGGIKKEVSISCSMAKNTCSVCGGDMKSHSCKHVKGRTYAGKKCYAILSQPGDAYEWSFVAVPAQRNAGVTKSFSIKEDTPLSNPVDIIKAMSASKALSDEEITSVKEYICKLEALAADAVRYKKHLTEEIERLALIALPKVNFKRFIGLCEQMSADELKELKKGLEAQATQKIPPMPQLRASAQKENTPNNTSFKI